MQVQFIYFAHGTLLYTSGLARLCTTPYHKPNDANMDQIYMHLTNYSLQKNQDSFVEDKTDPYSEVRGYVCVCMSLRFFFPICFTKHTLSFTLSHTHTHS
jgi:hypothetical protein